MSDEQAVIELSDDRQRLGVGLNAEVVVRECEGAREAEKSKSYGRR